MLIECGLNPVEHESFDKMVSLWDKNMEIVIGNKMKKLINLEFELGTLGKFEKTLNETINVKKRLLKEKMAEKNNNTYMFFTINPKPSVKLEEFLKVTAKAVTKTCFTSYLYVIEQRGNDSATAGKGFHAHILVKRNLNYKPAKCKDNMKSTFLKMCNVKNNALFNVKYLNTEWANDKVTYISTGGKTGDGKDVKQDIDVWWRKEFDILPYYGDIEITLN